MKPRTPPTAPAPTPAPETKKEVVRLVLTVEYDLNDTDVFDIMAAAKDLVEEARSYGRPLDTVITGLPTTLTVRS